MSHLNKRMASESQLHNWDERIYLIAQDKSLKVYKNFGMLDIISNTFLLVAAHQYLQDLF